VKKHDILEHGGDAVRGNAGGVTFPDLAKAFAFVAVALAAMSFLLLAGAKEAQAQVVDNVDVAEGNDVTVDVGDVEVGDEALREVRLVNTGGDTVTIGGVDLGALTDGSDAITGIELLDGDGNLLETILDEDTDLLGRVLNLLGGEGLELAPGEEAILRITVAPDVTVLEDGALDEINTTLEILGLDALGGVLGDTLNTVNIIGNATPADDDNPTISKIKPGKRTADRTPAVRATVADDNTNLGKEDIRVFFKGKPRTDFTYDQGTNRLKFKPGKLKYKKYTVRIEATDEQGPTRLDPTEFFLHLRGATGPSSAR